MCLYEYVCCHHFNSMFYEFKHRFPTNVNVTIIWLTWSSKYIPFKVNTISEKKFNLAGLANLKNRVSCKYLQLLSAIYTDTNQWLRPWAQLKSNFCILELEGVSAAFSHGQWCMLYVLPLFCVATVLLFWEKEIHCSFQYPPTGKLDFSVCALPGLLKSLSTFPRLLQSICTFPRLLYSINTSSWLFSTICTFPRPISIQRYLFQRGYELSKVPYVLWVELQIAMSTSFQPKRLIFFFAQVP